MRAWSVCPVMLVVLLLRFLRLQPAFPRGNRGLCSAQKTAVQFNRDWIQVKSPKKKGDPEESPSACRLRPMPYRALPSLAPPNRASPCHAGPCQMMLLHRYAASLKPHNAVFSPCPAAPNHATPRPAVPCHTGHSEAIRFGKHPVRCLPLFTAHASLCNTAPDHASLRLAQHRLASPGGSYRHPEPHSLNAEPAVYSPCLAPPCRAVQHPAQPFQATKDHSVNLNLLTLLACWLRNASLASASAFSRACSAVSAERLTWLSRRPILRSSPRTRRIPSFIAYAV